MSRQEPPPQTVWILCAPSADDVLPTIRSRCRLLRFERLSDADTAAVLRAQLPDADADEIASLVALAPELLSV